MDAISASSGGEGLPCTLTPSMGAIQTKLCHTCPFSSEADWENFFFVLDPCPCLHARECWLMWEASLHSNAYTDAGNRPLLFQPTDNKEGVTTELVQVRATLVSKSLPFQEADTAHCCRRHFARTYSSSCHLFPLHIHHISSLYRPPRSP